MLLKRFYVWRSLRRETTLEVYYARTIEEARLRYAAVHSLYPRMVEAKAA